MLAGADEAFTRFFTLADVAEVLNVALDTVRQLVDSNELAAIRLGGTGEFRVEQRALEEFIDNKYEARQREATFSQLEYTEISEIVTFVSAK